MKRFHHVVPTVTVLGFFLVACTPASESGAPRDDRGLYVSDELRDGRSGPEALWKGAVVIAESGCVQGQMDDGSYYNLEFPAGTHFNDAGEIDMGFAMISLGEEVAFGGGYMTEASPSTSPPENCAAESTFQVYTA